MTDKETYIKQAFKRYRENKKALGQMSFYSVRAVDYTKMHVKTNATDKTENAIIAHLDRKREIEKQIEIVEWTIWFYELDNEHGKVEYIKSRWFKRLPLYRVAMDCFISHGASVKWGKDILAVGKRAADMFNLY